MRMKDDLISRSDAAEFMFKNRMCTSINNAYDELRCIKTAYDVEKVVEQLEEEREYSYANFNEYVKEVSPCLDAEYDDVFSRGLERAIEIVKQGGTDE